MIAFAVVVTAAPGISREQHTVSSRTRITTDSVGLVSGQALRDGDIVFRKGTGFFSDVFRRVGGHEAPFSHVGVIQTTEVGSPRVTHCEASELTGQGKVCAEPLAAFIGPGKASAAAVYRVRGTTPEQGQTAAAAAERYAKARIPFDIDFDLRTADKMYCTEMVCLAWKEAGVVLAPKHDTISLPPTLGGDHREVISVWNMLQDPNLELISELTTGGSK